MMAGFVYFAVVFAIGFGVGVVRTLAIAPSLGEIGAVAAELPAMLLVSWLAAGRIIRIWRVPARSTARLLMGGVAFLALMAAEAATAALMLDLPLAAYLAAFTEPAKLIGLAGQVGFALIPLLRLWREESGPLPRLRSGG